MGSEERAGFGVRPQLDPKPAVDYLLLTGNYVPEAEIADLGKWTFRNVGVPLRAKAMDARRSTWGATAS